MSGVQRILSGPRRRPVLAIGASLALLVLSKRRSGLDWHEFLVRLHTRPQEMLRFAEQLLAAWAIWKLARKYLTVDGLLAAVPGAQAKVSQQIESEVTKAVSGMFPRELQRESVLRIPAKGLRKEEIIQKLKEWQKYDGQGDGKIFAYMYKDVDEEYQKFLEKVFGLFMHENALNAIVFPTLRKLEIELIQMTLNLFHGPPGSAGTLTSGGTESILCAIKAYREKARKERPHITKPEIVLPITAHVAFPKAGHMFDVKMVFVKALDKECRVDPAAMEAAITPNTIALVGSAPQYPNGAMDPIDALSEIAVRHNLPLHVDACVGGFFLPWLERLEHKYGKLPCWFDFRNPGVTSISADLHKYGFAAKGASTITWRKASDRKYQFYAYGNWPGGLFVSPSLLGTRGGGPIAAAWAAMVANGEDGYMKRVDLVMETSKKFQAGIAKIPGLRVVGKPDMSIVSLDSSDPNLNILTVADVLEDKYGFKAERQQNPNSLHLTLMPPHSQVVDEFLEGLEASVQHVRENPELQKEGSAALYGQAAQIPSDAIVDEFLLAYMGQVYSVDGGESEESKEP